MRPGIELAVVQSSEHEERGNGAHSRQGHVGLRIPPVALTAKEVVTRGFGNERHPPLEYLVEGAECKTEAEDEEVAPTG